MWVCSENWGCDLAPRCSWKASTETATHWVWLMGILHPGGKAACISFWQHPLSCCRAVLWPLCLQQHEFQPPPLKLFVSSCWVRSGFHRPRFQKVNTLLILPMIIFFAEKTGAGFERRETGTCHEANAGCHRQSCAVHTSSWFEGGGGHGAGGERLLLLPSKDLCR